MKKAMIGYTELSIILHPGYDSHSTGVQALPDQSSLFSFSFIDQAVIRGSVCFVFI